MQGWFRSLVSTATRPYEDSTIKYDLGYITPRLVVCSGPAGADSLKSWYRYPVEDLVKLLAVNHGDKWHVWNLRGEGKGYKNEEVYGKVSYYPFPDHLPPSFAIMLNVCKNIYTYLSQDGENVAVIHCRAGKGRSGTLACAYLMYESYIKHNNVIMTVDDANDLYTANRMAPGFGKGVSINSQLRYLQYWYTYLNGTLPQQIDMERFNCKCPQVSIQITGFVLKNALTYIRQLDEHKPFVTINVQGYIPSQEAEVGAKLVPYWISSRGWVKRKPGCNDYALVLKRPLMLKAVVDLRIQINQLLYVWFNGYFETIKSRHLLVLHPHKVKGTFEVPFEEMDGYKGTDCRGLKLFDLFQCKWVLKSHYSI